MDSSITHPMSAIAIGSISWTIERVREGAAVPCMSSLLPLRSNLSQCDLFSAFDTIASEFIGAPSILCLSRIVHRSQTHTSTATGSVAAKRLFGSVSPLKWNLLVGTVCSVETADRRTERADDTTDSDDHQLCCFKYRCIRPIRHHSRCHATCDWFESAVAVDSYTNHRSKLSIAGSGCGGAASDDALWRERKR